jgi:hypothetical protein
LVMGVVCANCNVGALAYSHHNTELVKKLLDFLLDPPSKRLGIETYAPEKRTVPSQLHTVWKRPAYARRNK